MDISAVRQKIADVLKAGVTSTPKLTALPYVPDSVPAPCAYTDDIEVNFDYTYGRGTDEATFTLRVLCSRADDKDGQKLLDGYLRGAGPASIKAVLEAQRQTGTGGKYAGDVCDDLYVSGVNAYRWFTVGEAKYVGAEFKITVIGSGD